MAKNSQTKMEIPIPFARSRLKIAANIANDVKITERKIPTKINEAPIEIEEYSKIGTPQPNKNAKTNAVESPRKILNQTLLLGTG